MEPRVIAERARHFLQEWQVVAVDHHLSTMLVPHSVLRWEKPTPRWTKLNVDAALNLETNTVNFGWVLRDEYGSFIATVGSPSCGGYSPKIADQRPWRFVKHWDG
ncbi:PREDICTED: uncharacterized protein LOC109183987 [Ipomoea nil]|uniref:uncharacterized protein LOC109183987 n=1 Tax=Ipomoea nil TaxID=35883 RepID=UPI000900D297|nr:PREDICTED: uncharacterized protein LOC109183987 [Ipomoea nil]